MRLNKKILQKKCRVKLHLARFLNVSGLDLATLENVNECGLLHWLIASDNKLQSDDGLENLQHLWYLDLSNNQMIMLAALSRYLALGTLILSNNNLKWIDLEKIRHAHILSISLHGNPCLDSDPYYRIHVIDCLPLIWELDGRLVTVTERLHVKQFFIDTELSQHPVRHKMGKTFRTTAIKNIGTEGIVSKQCKYIYSKFPVSETHTKHTDERRLAYLTHMVQEDILQWSEQLEKVDRRRPSVFGNFLDNLLEQRHKDPERCNMVMLLLVISLEFQLPTALIRSVLTSANLDMIGTVTTMPFFLLPAQHRTRVIGVLLNAAKIQRDNNKSHTGGLYPQLFMCLYYTVAQLTRISQTSEANMHKIKPIPMHSDYRALMAGEVVSLMLSIPRFFTYIATDSGVINLVTCATGDHEVLIKVQDLLYEAEDIFSVMTIRTAHKIGKSEIMNAIHERLNRINIKMSDIPIGDRYLSLSDSLPIKPLHSVIWASEFLTSGQCVPRLDPPILYPAKEAFKPKPQQPKTGDKVLLGPQVVGKLTMILEGEIALAKIDAVPMSNGAVESRLKVSDAHYTYVDLKALCFARDIAMWRPIKTEGDTYTIHSTESSELLAITQKEAHRSDTETSQPLIFTPRTKTLMVYAPGAIKSKERPKSSVETEKKLAQTSGRRTLSARLPNNNANFTMNNPNNGDTFLLENDINQIFQTEHLSTINNYTKPQPANMPHVNLSRQANEAPESLMPKNTRSLEYVAPVPSRSNSPAQRILDGTRETTTNKVTSDNEFKKEETSRKTTTDQCNKLTEVVRPSLSQQVIEENSQELHPIKDADTTSKVTWPDQVQDGESCQDPITEGEQSGLKNADSSTLDQNSDPILKVDVESTFLTTVSGQAEGLNTVLLEDKTGSEVKGPSNIETSVNESASTKNVNLTSQNHVETTRRPKTSKPAGTTRVKVGNKTVLSGRPKSAVDVSHNLLSRNPSFAVGSNTSNFLGGSDVLKSGFQQLREDVWKSSAKQGRSWPITAVMQRSNPLLPPPQRPTSPISSTVVRTQGLKVTSTCTWLGGGRDLYWEDIRRRPKSGHTPGWKEGLPESMRRRRSKSAHVTSARPQLSNSLFATFCTNCKTLEDFHSHPEYSASGASDENYLMLHTYQLLHHRPHLGSGPVPEDGHNIFPTLDPDARSTLHIQGLTVPRRPVRVPHEDSKGFTSSQAGGSHHGSYSEDQLHPDSLDDQDFMCVSILSSSPANVVVHKSQKHVTQKAEIRVITGQVIKPKSALSRIHPHSASQDNLQPVIQDKSLKRCPIELAAESDDTTLISGVQEKNFIPQAPPEKVQQAARNSSANRDCSNDSSLTDCSRYIAVVPSVEYGDADIIKTAVQDITDD